MTLHVPVCPRCNRHPRLESRHVDSQNYQVRFLAHRRLKQVLADLRKA